MKLVADIHLHSHFSRATSKNLTFEHLWKWAQLKGVQVVATGDVAHPGWLAELREKLEPAEDGLFRLKSEYASTVADETPASCRGTVRFLIGGEISNIYKRHDRTRKVHNIVFAPTVEATTALQAELEKIGNIRSDGRPILGLDSRDLLEIVLEVDDRCHLIPAHIWTPWFSVLGSKSGFDSLEACFADLTSHIFAVETGLSSDPPMNWRVSWLDDYTLISNSDAHSPPKLAREATLFDTELAYDALFDALRTGRPDRFLGTIEFFPEEGKYHLDGHRKCGVCWEPVTTLAHGGLCSACGKPVTVGVFHRVEELADRPPGARPSATAPFASLIPLPEALSEILGVGQNSKRVQSEYMRLLGRLGPELTILRETPLEDIAAAGGPLLAEGIRRMRLGEVHTRSGYDGEYGVIRMFDGETDRQSFVQIGMFAQEETRPKIGPNPSAVDGERRPDGAEGPTEAEDSAETVLEERTGRYSAPPQAAPGVLAQPLAQKRERDGGEEEWEWLDGLNPAQRAAATQTERPVAVVAGPGTGKTRTLTARVAHLILGLGAPPSSVLAVTFTNRAAEEMRERLLELLGEELAAAVPVGTFHQLGSRLLREFGEAIGIAPTFATLDEGDRLLLLREACPELSAREARTALEKISARKNGQREAYGADGRAAEGKTVWTRYQAGLAEAGALDFDDLIARAVQMLEAVGEVRRAVQARTRWIMVDEFQDVNDCQYRLLRLLAGGGANVCVIGDPDQAIYGFRGADHRYFLSFGDDFPGGSRITLEQNYRSAQPILDAAAQIISHNPDRQAKKLFSEFAEQVKPEVYRAPTDRAEAEYVVHQVEQMVGGLSYFSLDSGRVDGSGMPEARSFGDFAVLYRLNAQARLLEEAFARSGIPYETVGEEALSQQKPVGEIMALLWLTQTPNSPIFREKALPHGMGATEREKAAELVASLADGAGAAVSELVRAAAEGWSAVTGAEYSDTEKQRIARLARRAAPHRARLQEFLTTMALQSDKDHYEGRGDKVALMSLHASKGLEFPVVFIVGCEEGLLPFLPEGRKADVEEERRLFYVGMTRAQKRLKLIHAGRRLLYGRQVENPVSSFVSDIAAALKEVREADRRQARRRAADRQLKLL